MIYFVADTHFFDDTIRRYENRPFSNVQEMNEKVVHNWNNTVRIEDEVYVLGDLGNADADKMAEILNKLHGKKYLVKGNHDNHSNAFYREVGFEEVYDKPVILDGFWILSHEPLYVCENMPYANIFGHVHNSPLYKDYSKQHYCVSLERIQYVPISFEEIRQKVMQGEGNVTEEL